MITTNTNEEEETAPTYRQLGLITNETSSRRSTKTHTQNHNRTIIS